MAGEPAAKWKRRPNGTRELYVGDDNVIAVSPRASAGTGGGRRGGTPCPTSPGTAGRMARPSMRSLQRLEGAFPDDHRSRRTDRHGHDGVV